MPIDMNAHHTVSNIRYAPVFVTTAPPPTGKGGDYDFSYFSAQL